MLKNKSGELLLFSFLILLHCFLLVLYFQRFSSFVAYSPDTYFMLDLSKNIFGETNVSLARQFQFDNPWQNASFPPLYPFAIFLFHFVCSNLEKIPLIINLLILLINIVLLLFLSRSVLSTLVPGFISSFFLLLSQRYIEEVFAGGTMPCALMFSLVLILLTFKFFESTNKHSVYYILLLGFFASLYSLLRFDFLLAGLLFFIPLILLKTIESKREKIFLAFLYLLVYIVCLLPWILYSWKYFSVPWISDNARTGLLIQSSYVTDYLPGWDLYSPSIFSDFWLWVNAYFEKIIRLFPLIYKVVISFRLNLFLFLVFLLINGFFYKKIMQSFSIYSSWLKTQITIGFCLVCVLFSVALSGYFLPRYLIVLNAFYLISILFGLYIVLKPKIYAYSIICFFLVVASSSVLLQSVNKVEHTLKTRFVTQRLTAQQVNFINSSINSRQPRILFLGDIAEAAAYYSFIAKQKTILYPRNLRTDNLGSFLNYIHPTHLIYDQSRISFNDLLAFGFVIQEDLTECNSNLCISEITIR